VSTFETKAYIAYYYTLFEAATTMNASNKDEEIRWQVMVAMLEEFPRLREKVKNYLKNRA
jgi:hypothetical protein